jgi:hypothetical protein
MKRFLVFAGDFYYPSGGWGDFQGDFDSIDEAKDKLLKIHKDWEWSQVIDSETKKEVVEGSNTWDKKYEYKTISLSNL